MDSLVEELNLKQKQVSSLPTTASIISANERRKYVMESDDEHDEAKVVKAKEQQDQIRLDTRSTLVCASWSLPGERRNSDLKAVLHRRALRLLSPLLPHRLMKIFTSRR